MLNWYRAAVRKAGDTAAIARPVPVPTLIIWGEEDAFLVPEMAEASLAYCPQGRLARVPEAGHWVKDEAPAAVNRLLLDWLATPPQSSDSTRANSL
jgi:pimeloyl-ACP methyl ester carboxylesterase